MIEHRNPECNKTNMNIFRTIVSEVPSFVGNPVQNSIGLFLMNTIALI